MFGGFGNDRIHVHDGVADAGEAEVIICGRGVDRDFVDNGSVVLDNLSPDCEYVNGKSPSTVTGGELNQGLGVPARRNISKS